MSEDSRVDSGSEKLENGPRFLSSLEKEFSKENKIVKKMKVFTRSKVCVEEHTGRLVVTYMP